MKYFGIQFDMSALSQSPHDMVLKLNVNSEMGAHLYGEIDLIKAFAYIDSNHKYEIIIKNCVIPSRMRNEFWVIIAYDYRESPTYLNTH